MRMWVRIPNMEGSWTQKWGPMCPIEWGNSSQQHDRCPQFHINEMVVNRRDEKQCTYIRHYTCNTPFEVHKNPKHAYKIKKINSIVCIQNINT